MDSDNHLFPDDGLETVHQNGVNEQSCTAGEDGVVSDNLSGSTGNTFKVDDYTNDNPSTREVKGELKVYVGSNGLSVSKVCLSLCALFVQWLKINLIMDLVFLSYRKEKPK